MDYLKMKEEHKREMLVDLCKQLADYADDSTLTISEDVIDVMLSGILAGLEESNGDDTFGTQGWEYYFGYGE